MIVTRNSKTTPAPNAPTADRRTPEKSHKGSLRTDTLLSDVSTVKISLNTTMPSFNAHKRYEHSQSFVGTVEAPNRDKAAEKAEQEFGCPVEVAPL